jgi:hypothetical protein
MASFGGSNTTIGFTTITPQPIVITIDLSGTYFASELDLPQDSGTHDTRVDENTNEMVGQLVVGPEVFEFIVYSICLISLCIIITHEYRGHAMRSSKLSKLRVAKQSRLQKLYTTDYHDYIYQQEDVKK